MTKKPIILSKEIVAQTAVFTVERLHLKFSNGEERYYERVKGRSDEAVLIIPLLDENTLLLIREYGAGIDDYVLAFPKGALDKPEESIFNAANRELMEETGYGSRDLSLLVTLNTSPGYMRSCMHVVVAKNLYPQTIEGDEPEPIEVVPWPLNQLEKLLAMPDFNEGRSAGALLYLLSNQGLLDF